MHSVLLLGLMLHADVTKDAANLEGTWVVTSMVENGKPKEELKGDKLVFDQAGTVTIKNEKREEKGTYKLDPSGKPKAIDIKQADSEKPYYGIYTLDGDTLKICMSPDEGKPRPTEFTAKEGSGLMILELKREKK